MATAEPASKARDTIAEMLKALRAQGMEITLHGDLEKEVEEIKKHLPSPDSFVLKMMHEDPAFEEIGMKTLITYLENLKDHVLAMKFHELRVLVGKRVSSSGRILDYEGKPIGRLCCGDRDLAAGATVGERGEVFDKHGEYVGHAVLNNGKPAQRAYQEMMEE